MSFHAPNQFRIRTGPLGSDDSIGNNGAFNVLQPAGPLLFVICSTGGGWEHVSVTVRGPGPARTPTWAEMCYLKRLFWDDEDSVMQLHPPQSEWVNNHAFCLHLWRPTEAQIPVPPGWMVGVRELNPEQVGKLLRGQS